MIRLIILLAIVQSCRKLVELLERTWDDIPSPSGETGRSSSPSPSFATTTTHVSKNANLRRRLLLGPVLSLETKLMEACGLMEEVKEQRDPADLVNYSSAYRRRGLAASFPPPDLIFKPGSLGRKGVVVVGSSRGSRRAQAQGKFSVSTAGLLRAKAAFCAGPEDPVHLISALKDEILGLWDEAITHALIPGEGPRKFSTEECLLTHSEKLWVALFSLRDLPKINHLRSSPTAS